MSKKVAVVLADSFEDVEYTSPVEALNKEGFDTVVIGTEAGQTVKGKKGTTEVTLDKSIAEVKAADFDALLIPGGVSPDNLRADEEGRFGQFTTEFMNAKKPIFAICHGPQLLIDTDQLDGRKVTSFISVRKDLMNAGAEVVDESVVVDGNIITSRTPDDLPDFNREIINALQ